MWIADGWKDYEVIDTSCGEKLERWVDGQCVANDTGEIQYTDYGISGIPVFQEE